MAKEKRHLTKGEEFEIMKLVLDKFLLLGVLIMGIGIYELVTSVNLLMGFIVLAIGAFLMILFGYILVKEYNFIDHR